MGCKVEESLKGVNRLLGTKGITQETSEKLNSAKIELESIIEKRKLITGSNEVKIDNQLEPVVADNEYNKILSDAFKSENVDSNNINEFKLSKYVNKLRDEYKRITGSSIQYTTMKKLIDNKFEYKTKDTDYSKSESLKESIKNVNTNRGVYRTEDTGSNEVNNDNIMGSFDGGIGIKTGESIEFKMNEEFSNFITDMLEDDHASGAIDDYNFDSLVTVAEGYMDALAELGVDTVTKLNLYELSNNENVDPIGEYDPNTSEININLGTKNLFFGKAEVVLHEIQHKLIDTIISKDPGSKLNKQIKELRNQTREQINKKYNGSGWKMFLVDKPNYTAEHEAIAKKIFDYAFSNPNGAKQNSEFLAYATTNKYMMNEMYEVKVDTKILDKLEIPKGKRTLADNFKMIANIFIDAINLVYKSFYGIQGKDNRGGESTGRLVADSLLKTGLDLMTKNEKDKLLEPEVDGTIREMYKKYEEKVTPIVEKMAVKIGLIDTDKISLKKDRGIAKWFDQITNYKGLAKIKREIILGNALGNAFKDTANNRHAWFYQLVRSSKHNIDAEIQTLKGVIRKRLNDEFKMSDFDENTRKKMKRLLIDTDATIIETDELEKLFNDDNYLKSEIERLKVEINDEFSVNHAEMLGYQLYNGEPGGWNGYNNAHEIARASEVKFKEDGIHKIDTLATLYAINESELRDRLIIGDFITNHKEAAHGLLNGHKSYKRELEKGIYIGKKILLEKGFRIEAYNGTMVHQIVEAKDVESMKRINSLKVIKEVTDLETITGKKYYLMAGESTDTSYTEGLISTVQLKSEGISLRGLLVGQGKISSEINIIIKSLAESTQDTKIKKGAQQFIPVREINGVISDYRLVVSQKDKEEFLEINNDIVETLVNTFGNIEHKYLALENNVRAVNEMIRFDKEYYKGHEDEFILIRPSSKEEKAAEIEYEFAKEWARLPQYTRQYIYSKRKESSIRIPKDMLIDFIGYKDVSLQNAKFIKDNVTAKKAVGIVEKMWQDLIKRYKSLIVITMGNTIVGNYQSNAVVAMAEAGIGPIEYAKRFTNHWDNLNQYMKDHEELVSLTFLKKAGNKGITEARLKGLQADLENNPVYVLVKDGQFSTILEDVNMVDEKKETILSRKINKMFDKSPEALRSIKDFVYLDEKTMAYQKLMKITQYSDIVNRAIIHEEFMKKKTMTERESLNYVDQLYVNYSYLDNKYLKWGNDMGTLWFTKFLFRSLPAVAKSLVRKPLLQAMLQAAQSVTGINLEQPVDNYFNVFNALGNRMGPVFDPVDMFSTMLSPNFTNPILR